MPRLVQGELVLDRYRLDSRLGSGASAEVWLATDERLGRTVALKVLHAHLLPGETSPDRDVVLQRFVDEARAVARLRHPGIVGIHDVVGEGDVTAIVFEHVPGESLEARLRRPPPPTPEESAAIAADVAEALAAAHAAGIVHRDVKPANVLLSAPDGRARLVDFGVARALDPAHARLTRAGEVVGTLSTMAPEQLAGGDPGVASDLYALGVILYELLAGRLPFDASTPAALAEQQRRLPPPIPDAPAPLVDLARRLLRHDPRARPGSAAEVAAFLRGWLRGVEQGTIGADAAASGQRSRIVPSGPTDPTLLALAAPLPRPRWRQARFVAVPLALAGLAALVVLALAFQSILPAAPAATPSTPGATTGATAAITPSPSTPPVTPSPPPTPSPTETASPTPVPTPTPVPVPTALAILAPADGAVVSAARVDISGEAPPGATVTHDIPFAPDDHATADDQGRWSMVAILHPGDNALTFRLDDDRSTDITIHVTYQP